MPNIFQQFMGKARPTVQAPTLGGTMGNYLSQVQDVGDMVARQQGMPPAPVGSSVDYNTPMPPRFPKTPALDIIPKTPKQPRQTFGQLNKRTVAPAEFRKNTMAGYVTDALKAQLIAKILESNQ
jgi:hypothetical protein